MGTDIHCVAQVRLKGEWGTLSLPNPDYDENAKWSRWKGPTTLSFMRDRWYRLFSVLANVRNGFGFAGIKTGDPIVPISLPKGYPKDFAVDKGDFHPRFMSEAEDPDNSQHLWMGDHSHTWLTLRELRDYNWDFELVQYGIVSGPQRYKMVLEGSKVPSEYSLGGGNLPCGVCGKNVHHVTLAELDELLSRSSEPPSSLDRYYAPITWTESGKDHFEEFLKKIDWLKQFVTDEMTDEDVRLVMGFDS